MSEHREWVIGRTTFRFEPPDLLHAVFLGAPSREDAVRMVALYRELGSVRPFFVVRDMSGALAFDSEVGRYISENMHSEWLLATVYFGTRLIHRALISGIVFAAYVIGRADASAMKTLHFVSTRQEALARVEQLRAGSRVSGGLTPRGQPPAPPP